MLQTFLSYSLIYSGVDCIDVSADIAVVKAATDGITAGVKASKQVIERPLLMISVNDDEVTQLSTIQITNMPILTCLLNDIGSTF